MSNKLMIIVIGVLFIFLVGMGGGIFFMWSKISSIEDITKEDTEEIVEIEDENENEKEIIGPIFSLDTFVVNLADPSGDKYARIRIELELKNDEILEKIEKISPRIYDSILMILSSKLSEEIRSIEGKNKMKEEIIESINTIFRDEEIIAIYFREFVIQ
jgi:flagellar FliL protein